MKTVCLLSGGLDSTTLLYWLLDQKHEVLAVSFFYGQKHAKEIEVARDLCKTLAVEHLVVDLSAVYLPIKKKGALLDASMDVPNGKYSETIDQTVVPFRNSLFLLTAAAIASDRGAAAVAYGAHAGDSTVYPDCRVGFAVAMQELFREAEEKDEEIVLLCPFIDRTKKQVVQIGRDLGVPLNDTWSCYKGLEQQCGECSTCLQRMEAIQCTA